MYNNTGVHLILGGARSGKSRLGQQRAEQWLHRNKAGGLTYLATATAGDNEMSTRIARHREDRDHRWRTTEESIALAGALVAAPESHCVLVDCLTLWLSNCLHQGVWEREREELLRCIDQRHTNCKSDTPPWVLVSNEVGSGIVPLGQLSREFVDAAGWIHQALAERADNVTLAIAGLPLTVK
ncbi:bifunctional adenosylcobinamide kinase/adenosylcobinamide-phosphate guanylyltransferase [Microbulbifer sp. OS29]|uniref:Bifunctional adenosylcobalamin biosynthesis protein n=1 Tax=Microbulbifer okhotskensis TaxID=2926617 RepID=A0A9X2ERP1_9GAMM|nr:bifunctional adenosylcobinamide kinase/adenosylcobinamide-phosphate guanylyltransferase [Microbulbifer okhotskensis]MCO1336155.1 bifunctional adenosylcobinamide kinase/adenosylcobinamide-phosphate guanylyltransferase [Microbulbifer okhotskensis]